MAAVVQEAYVQGVSTRRVDELAQALGLYYTPKHAYWMNQVELWLSILVRKLLKRGRYSSLENLRGQILAFRAYYNCTMAKPTKWTYAGIA